MKKTLSFILLISTVTFGGKYDLQRASHKNRIRDIPRLGRRLEQSQRFYAPKKNYTPASIMCSEFKQEQPYKTKQQILDLHLENIIKPACNKHYSKAKPPLNCALIPLTVILANALIEPSNANLLNFASQIRRMYSLVNVINRALDSGSRDKPSFQTDVNFYEGHHFA